MDDGVGVTAPELAPVRVPGSQLFELLVSGVLDYAILTLDLEGRVTSWNAGAERIKGYSAADMVGQNFRRFYPAVDIEAGKPDMELRVATAVGRFEDEGWRVRKDGTQFWANVIITAMRDADGHHIGFSKLTRDMTERRAAEQAVRQANDDLERRVLERTAALEASNEELDAFTYSVSHDLRAPLRAIEGFVSILGQEHSTGLSEVALDFLDEVAGSARHMGRLIDDLLAFSRLGRDGMTVTAVRTGELVAPVVRSALEAEPGRDLEVQVGELPDCLADQVLLSQVFVNLVSNAVKYTRGRPDAGIRISGHVLPDGSREFCVQDDGVGFDDAYAGKLFGVFQRLHRAEDYEGTGVGLAIVKRIVTRHGGSVRAEGRVGVGATFRFVLPAQVPA